MKRGLAALSGCANGRRPDHSSEQRSQPTEKDISEGWLRTPSSEKSRTSLDSSAR